MRDSGPIQRRYVWDRLGTVLAQSGPGYPPMDPERGSKMAGLRESCRSSSNQDCLRRFGCAQIVLQEASENGDVPCSGVEGSSARRIPSSCRRIGRTAIAATYRCS